MKDIYEECPMYKKKIVSLRKATIDDAEELLKCYSNENAVRFFKF